MKRFLFVARVMAFLAVAMFCLPPMYVQAATPTMQTRAAPSTPKVKAPRAKSAHAPPTMAQRKADRDQALAQMTAVHAARMNALSAKRRAKPATPKSHQSGVTPDELKASHAKMMAAAAADKEQQNVKQAQFKARRAKLAAFLAQQKTARAAGETSKAGPMDAQTQMPPASP